MSKTEDQHQEELQKLYPRALLKHYERFGMDGIASFIKERDRIAYERGWLDKDRQISELLMRDGKTYEELRNNNKDV